MTQQIFDRQDFIKEGDEIKRNAFWAVMAAHETKITEEAMHELLFEAFSVYGYVIRAQMLEGVSHMLASDTLTEERLDHTLTFLAKRLDGSAARLGNLVELVEETKTPGYRH